jgi:hypothetical protein
MERNNYETDWQPNQKRKVRSLQQMDPYPRLGKDQIGKG